MKITAVKIHHVEWDRGPYHWRDGIMPKGPLARTALLRILTDEGIVDASTEIDGEGYAQPWDEPGLGIEVDWDWIEKHTVGVEE
jgi:hypothetical protein